MFFFVALLFPIIVLRNAGFRGDSQCSFIDLSYNELRDLLRKTFIAEYNKDARRIDAANSYIINFNQLGRFVGIWRRLILTSLYNLAQNGVAWKPIIHACISALNGASSNPQNIYIFSLSHPTSYMAAMLLVDYFKCNISVVSSNSPMYAMNRYIFLPHSKLILCSKYQKEEYRMYHENGWVKVRECVLWGLEETLHYQGLTYSPPKFDIGIYSDASWARDGGIWRTEKLSELKRQRFFPNFKYDNLCTIIQTCISLKMKDGYSVKVYLHPFERRLFQDHNIKPPFTDLLEKNDIEIDNSGQNSIESIYESRLGISGSSTIVLDRIHVGLQGVLYFDERQVGNTYYHNKKFFGKYSHILVESSVELESKIKELCTV